MSGHGTADTRVGYGYAALVSCVAVVASVLRNPHLEVKRRRMQAAIISRLLLSSLAGCLSSSYL